MNKAEIINEVRDYLDENDWKYEYQDVREIITTGVNLKCKFQSMKILFIFNDNGVSLYAMLPIKVEDSAREMALEYLSRANYGVRIGNFEIDLEDGEIRYKVYLSARGMEKIPGEQIEEALIVAVSMINRYGDNLMKVMMGFANSAEEEIAAAEK